MCTQTLGDLLVLHVYYRAGTIYLGEYYSLPMCAQTPCVSVYTLVLQLIWESVPVCVQTQWVFHVYTWNTH